LFHGRHAAGRRHRRQETLGKHLRRFGPAEEEALRFLAAVLAQALALGLGFDALGDDLKIEVVRHVEDGADHRGVLA
jgi:hypothetical protein